MDLKSTIKNVSGRLVEIYLRQREFTDEQIADVQSQLVRAVQGASRHGGQIIVVGDLRELNVVGPKLADYILSVMRSDNKHLLRSAQLCDPNAIFGMQLERVIRESGHPDRKRFTNTTELTEWLREVLTVDELTRLVQFLEKGPLPP